MKNVTRDFDTYIHDDFGVRSNSSKLRYYEVGVKMGHVGRNRFYQGALFIKAYSGKEAASIARLTPRVKHDKKFAIQGVDEIDYLSYLKGVEDNMRNPYFRCRNRQEQNQYGDVIWDHVFEEPEKVTYKNTKHSLRKSQFLNDDFYNEAKVFRCVDLSDWDPAC